MCPLLAARSGRSGGCDALVLTPATLPDATRRRSRNTRGDHGRRSRHQLRETAQVLCGGRQRELELGATRSAQPQAAEMQDALQVREQHLDAFALTARPLEGLGLGERTRNVTSLLIDAAQDLRAGSFGQHLDLKAHAEQSSVLAR